MSVDTKEMREVADECESSGAFEAEVAGYLRSAADEIDKMCTALAMEPHISEQLDAERAAHAETRAENEELREKIVNVDQQAAIARIECAELRKRLNDASEFATALFMAEQDAHADTCARLKEAEAIVYGDTRDPYLGQSIDKYFAKYGRYAESEGGSDG